MISFDSSEIKIGWKTESGRHNGRQNLEEHKIKLVVFLSYQGMNNNLVSVFSNEP